MKRNFTRTLLFWGLSIAILVFSFVSLWQRDQMTRVGYDIQKMQAQKESLMKLHKELSIEVESLSALDRIEDVAILQLAMIPAPIKGRVYIEEKQEQPIGSSQP